MTAWRSGPPRNPPAGPARGRDGALPRSTGGRRAGDRADRAGKL